MLLVVGLLYARLLAGPISLTFLTNHIEQALQREFAGLGVDIEDVSARLSEAGTVAFELTNIRVSDAAGSPLAFAPSASLSLSRRALRNGHLAPETIDLISPRLLLYYSEDGNLSVKFTPPGDAVDDPPGKAPALRGPPRRTAVRRRLLLPIGRNRGSISSGPCRKPRRVRADAKMPAPTCAAWGSGRQPSSSTTAAARASGASATSTSISIIAAAAARSPAGPASNP